jgi:hypothetical protein
MALPRAYMRPVKVGFGLDPDKWRQPFDDRRDAGGPMTTATVNGDAPSPRHDA